MNRIGQAGGLWSQKHRFLNRNGQSLSNQAKTVERAEEENEIGSTNQPEILEKISSDRRNVHFVELPTFQSEHNIRQMSNQLRKTPENNISEKQVDEQSSAAVEKFNEKAFQSVHNIGQNATPQGKPSGNEDIDKNVVGQVENNGMLTNPLVKEVQATENNPAGMRGDSNEDEYFNETDFKSAHNISQNSGQPFWVIYGRYK